MKKINPSHKSPGKQNEEKQVSTRDVQNLNDLPVNPLQKKNKKPGRLPTHWKQLNEQPPSYRLQKISIYVTMFLTGVAALLAWFALDTSETNKALKEQLYIMDLSTRPAIRSYAYSIKATDKGVTFVTNLKSFGQRGVTSLVASIWFVSNYTIYRGTAQTVRFLDPGEATVWENALTQRQVPFGKLDTGYFVIKFRYTDIVDNRMDSSYEFAKAQGGLLMEKFSREWQATIGLGHERAITIVSLYSHKANPATKFRPALFIDAWDLTK